MLAGASRSLVVEDSRADPAFAARPTTHALGIGAYTGVPLYRPDGALYGTLCTLHSHARAVPEGETALLALAGRIVMQAVALGEARLREADQATLLAASEGHLRAVLASAPVALLALDAAGGFALCAGSCLGALGLAPGQLVGLSVYDVYRDDPAALDRFHRARAGEEVTALVETGGAVIEMRWAPSGASVQGGSGVVVVGIDITARRRAEEALRHQALHDALTGLPNRALLGDRLAAGVRGVARHRTPLALLLIDLDRFKDVNDTLGHHHGDLLLRQVGARMGALLRATDTVARLGGDEFAVVLPGADSATGTVVAAKIATALAAPFAVEGRDLTIGASIGIAVCPEHGVDAETLLRRADVAMYAAKGRGGGHAVYDTTGDGHTLTRLELERDLRVAVAEGGLVLQYQPIVEVSSGAVQGVEALARWPHPTHGFVPPDQFIPLAEGMGLIGALTDWVLDTAIRQGRVWRDAGYALAVAVNVSATTLLDPRLPATIERLLRVHGVAGSALRLEVTESAVMADPARAGLVLARLAATGLGISVDDYGTGCSSLAYLKRLPIDELKIDRAFVRHLVMDEADRTIVASTIGLGHSLGLRVIAEGVEDQATWEALAALGCDAVQGYHLGRPMPAAGVDAWVRARTRTETPS